MNWKLKIKEWSQIFYCFLKLQHNCFTKKKHFLLAVVTFYDESYGSNYHETRKGVTRM